MNIIIYLSLHTLNMGLLKYLSLNQVPTEITLLLRGIFCIVMALALAYQKKLHLIPRKPSLQLGRLFIAGSGLALMIASYKYINASTVAVLFKFDVIFLIFIMMFFKRKIGDLFFYSFGAFVLLFIHMQYLMEPSERILGYFLALSGTFIISIGFILLSRSGQSENRAVTCIVPGISLALFGIVLGGVRQGEYLAIKKHLLFLGATSGVVMFLIYIYTLKLYQKHSVVFTEVLTFLCILLFIPIEIWGLETLVSFQHIISILIIASYTFFIYLKKERQNV